MRYYYEVSYSLFDETILNNKGRLGLMHDRKCNKTIIKAFIKKVLPADKKALEIEIAKSELISEEEAIRRFGVNILNVQFKRRLGK